MLVDHLPNIVKELKNLEEQLHRKHLYRNDLDRFFFPHNAGYSDSKYLANRTILDKILNESYLF